MPSTPEIVDLGRAGYESTRESMLRWVAEARKDEVGGKVVLVEHDAVYTAGRATPPEQLDEDTIPVERGGRITYHGPGQLVVYPILRIPGRDVRGWLRRLEALGVAVCAHFGLDAEPSVDGTGVFVGGKKVVSIGVAVRHWVSMHGLSINVDMDLSAFQRIRPCGLDPDVMTDLSQLVGHAVSMQDAKDAVKAHLALLTAPTTAPRSPS